MSSLGTIEIFDLESSRLVFSSGSAPRAEIDQTSERDYLVIRRRPRPFIPRARILSFPLSEFLDWYYNGESHFSAFSTISPRDYNFLLSGEL